MSRTSHFIAAGVIALTSSLPAAAAENWDLCRTPSFEFVASESARTAGTLIEAQSVNGEDSNRLQLSGNVSLTRAEQQVNADVIRIDKQNEALEASGNVVFEDPNYRLQSPAISVENASDRAIFESPKFELRNRHARGQADRIEKLDAYRSRFSNLEYTSCDPQDRDWHLRADRLEIDNQSGRGSATHTTLYFMEVPFLYLPYFQFPVDDRRLSGILTPRIGYTEDRGTDILLPIYWNMAPNYDMTITPSWYSKRGLQLNTENRYLFRHQRGQLDLSYLDDDELDDSRWFQQWRHTAELPFAIGGDLLFTEVSDEDFFDDFDTVAPRYNSTRHLERYLRLNRTFGDWNSQLLVQRYQTLDPDTAVTNRPYDRLPRFTLDGPAPSLGENSTGGIDFEWVEFDRDDSITGARAHLLATLDWESSDAWYFLKPELQLAFTEYRLDNNPDGNNLERSLPTFALDSGLIFERLAGTQNQWLQTLEPRLYFLHTPFEDQDAIPDFDTSLNSRTYNNLFRNNRFTGADRIGDASQVTFGLSSRILDNDSGDELLNARVGQIYYFKDRRVSLDGQRQDASRSDTIAELDIWPNPATRISSRLVYEQAQEEITEKDLSINYAGAGVAANLGYYFTDDELEQGLASIVYPLNERWTLVAKIHRSIRFDQPVEHLLGLNYESCCWGIKILAGQTGDEADDFAETDNSIYFEITLKGLSQAGQDIDAQLRDAIPGYDPRF